MALSLLTTPIAGDIIQASVWIAEFNNIYNNPVTLLSPLTAGINLNGQTLSGAATFSGTITFSGAIVLGTPASGNATNLTNIPAANLSIAGQTALDLLYASSSTAWARLAKGTANQILSMDGTAANITWTASGLTIGTTAITSGTTTRLLYDLAGVVQEAANITYDGTNLLLAAGSVARMLSQNRFRYLNASCNINNSARQSVNDSTWTTLTWDTEDHDTDAMHSTSSNTDRITFNLTGKYLVWLNVIWVGNSTAGRRKTQVLKNVGATAIIQWEGITQPTTSLDTAYVIAGVFQFAAADYIIQQGYQTSGGALNYGHAADGAQWGAVYLGE